MYLYLQSPSVLIMKNILWLLLLLQLLFNVYLVLIDLVDIAPSWGGGEGGVRMEEGVSGGREEGGDGGYYFLLPASHFFIEHLGLFSRNQ